MSIKCIIIDDELEARDGLSVLLDSDKDIDVIQVCSNGLDAIQSINRLKPDLILLDIQMPGANGFEVLQNISVPLPEVIFITAFDQFALKAFEVHALDYLLKPFSDDRFYEALEHAKGKLINKDNRPAQIMEMANKAVDSQKPNAPAMLTLDGKLALKSDGKIHFLERSTVIWIEAFDYYIKVHVKDSFLLVRESMKNILNLLGSAFARIHKSAIINISHINSIESLPNNELEVELTNRKKLKVSRSFKPGLVKKISKG